MSEASGTAVLIPRENVNDESATLVAWQVVDGSFVEAGAIVAQIETSKAVVDLMAPASGILRHEARAGQDVAIGGRIGRIGGEGPASKTASTEKGTGSERTREVPVPFSVDPFSVDVPVSVEAGKANRAEQRGQAPPLRSGASPHGSASETGTGSERTREVPIPVSEANGSGVEHVRNGSMPLAPSVRRLVAEGGLDPSQVAGTGRGGRITKGDVVAFLESSPSPQPPTPPRSTRFSRRALERMAALGLDRSAFEGRGLVRLRDLEPRESPAPTAPSIAPASKKPVAASGVASHSEPLSRAKRTEGKYLRSGFESTLASVITVACPTRGFRSKFGPDASALIVFEVARLLRKYPAFNAYHDDGVAHYYDEVNVGFAVDAGRGLKVPIIREADRKGVAAIGSEMRDLVVGYLDDRLPVESLAGGTFTLTDLSGEGVVAFHPLINRGQSAILGVCTEVLPGGGREGTFNLVLAFDHQLAEGRTAARFLGDLRDRLASHEASRPGGWNGPVVEEPRCSRCQASYSSLERDGHVLIQTVRADGSPRLLCKLCFEGWI
jgi:2-oxoglutarate dehydrogenase E2 component (dihydrolipoamide succinyltransferase)